jgi:O-antigen ligase
MVAILVWVVFTLGLFWLDRVPKSRSSKALWLPSLWLFIGASRNFSEWFHTGGGVSSSQSDAYLEGNPVDRAVLSAILALGIMVLFARRRKMVDLLRSNKAILLYFGYCLISVLWSDYPDVSFKRWFRAVGDLVMVLVVLSDPIWVPAFRRLFARLGFLLVPLSVLLIRYFPDMGRTYAKDGSPSWTGASTDKNALGMLCLVFGLAAIFRFMTVFDEQKTGRARPLIAQAILIALTAYLTHEAHSATALACFILAGSLMVLTYLFRWARKPVCLNVMVVGVLAVAVSALFLGVGTGLVHGLGRESTLTGRTSIWHAALGQVRNPLLGTGFESFWLGPRLRRVSIEINQGVNEAHNGYIEVYLNLGWVGLAALAGILFTGYRRIIPAVRQRAPMASLRLAYFVSAVAYNFSEAGFKMMHPMWIILLLAVAAPKTAAPARTRNATPSPEGQSVADPGASSPEPVALEPEGVTILPGQPWHRTFSLDLGSRAF